MITWVLPLVEDRPVQDPAGKQGGKPLAEWDKALKACEDVRQSWWSVEEKSGEAPAARRLNDAGNLDEAATEST